MFGNVHYKEWGIWLEKHHWDLFTTLTFKEPTDLNQANSLVRRWLRELNKATENKVHYIMITEIVNHIPRYHLFITNAQNQYAHIWKNHWHKLGGIGMR